MPYFLAHNRLSVGKVVEQTENGTGKAEKAKKKKSQTYVSESFLFVGKKKQKKLRVKSVFNNKKCLSFVHFLLSIQYTEALSIPNLLLFIATTRYFALECRLSRLRFTKLRTLSLYCKSFCKV
jgi:hypothetical protein